MIVCTGCAKGPLITIRMRVGGNELVFRRCARCEANRWEREESVLTLDEVLELARTSR